MNVRSWLPPDSELLPNDRFRSDTGRSRFFRTLLGATNTSMQKSFGRLRRVMRVSTGSLAGPLVGAIFVVCNRQVPIVANRHETQKKAQHGAADQ